MKYETRPQVLDWIAGILTLSIIIFMVLHEGGKQFYLKLIGIAAFFAAIVFWILPLKHLKLYGEVSGGKKYYQTTKVADKGIYSVLRHPQYLAYIFLVVGFAFISQHYQVVLLSFGAVIFFYMYILDEEKYLIKKFGNDYSEYMKKVPRLNFVWGVIKILIGKNRKPLH